MGETGKGLHRNAMSYVGGLVMGVGATLVALSLAMEFGLSHPSPYLGIFTYLLFPMVLAAGFGVFLWGMRRESMRRRRSGLREALPYPLVDLNLPAHRRKFAWVLVGGGLLVVLLAFVSYNAFLFTESVTFCGKICHTVMEPEFTAYQQSPHARVPCVDCHVGAGATWYVKSKLSGLRQVVAVTFGTYETPIPVPIKDLRPARETCEECHWPEKFFGAQLVQNPHFRYDEQNTAEQMSLIVKTGGGGRGVGLNAGIHWHMILSAQVTYVSTDPQLQVIPWFKVHRSDGTEAEYVTLDDPPDAATLGTLPQHQLTCIDCHNRPSHVYQPPDTSTDRAMANGSIPASLPFIKQTAVEALLKDWPDKEAAHRGLADDIQGFYRDRYPEVAQKNQDQIQKAVESVTSIYDHSVFPEMRVNWASYASNIGHRNWPGCFRCHDGRHVRKDDGTPLSRDCTICHTLPQRGPLAPLAMTAPAADVNWHVWELKGKHEKMQCVRCHAVGKRPAPTCAECHKLDAKAPMMGSCSDCHEKAQEVKPLVACTDCHDSLGGLHAKGGHPDAPCLTCHKLHVWKPAADRSLCLTCHKDYTNHHADGGACMSCHAFRK